MGDMYFLEKKGVYGHGVYWIGDNQADGIAEANRRAELDEDNYHQWLVKKFVHQSNESTCYDAEHEVVYEARGKRQKEYVQLVRHNLDE